LAVPINAPFVRGLLVDQVAKTGGVSVDAFDATSIRTFLLERIHGRSTEYARLLATALRSFFRFLFLNAEADSMGTGFFMYISDSRNYFCCAQRNLQTPQGEASSGSMVILGQDALVH
jgi:hypothetical protein